MRKSLRLDDIGIPTDYFELSTKDKKKLCNELLDQMIQTVDEKVSPHYNRTHILKVLINSSIESNKKEENYEICGVLSDILMLINESGD